MRFLIFLCSFSPSNCSFLGIISIPIHSGSILSLFNSHLDYSSLLSVILLFLDWLASVEDYFGCYEMTDMQNEFRLLRWSLLVLLRFISIQFNVVLNVWTKLLLLCGLRSDQIKRKIFAYLIEATCLINFWNFDKVLPINCDI